MASTYTSTPRSTHSHPQHQRAPSLVTDTPTPSSHSQHSLNPPFSSIRPIASTHPALKTDLGAAALKRRATLTARGAGLRAGSPNTLGREPGGGPRSASRLSKASSSQLFESELEALAAGDPIMRDNTELDRINKENSIQRMIGDLQADRLSLSSASVASSVGEIVDEDKDRRKDFTDEDAASSASSSRSSSRSRSSLSSFRIGLAARTSFERQHGAAGGARKDPLDPLDVPTEDEEQTEDDITYVTLPRSNANDSPARTAAPPATATSNARPTGLFGSPRPLGNGGGQHAQSSPLRPPSNRYGDENLPPAAPAPYSFRRSPLTTNSYPTLPARSNPPPTFIRSPAAAGVNKPQTQARPSPLNPQINSPVLGNSPTATYTGTGSRSGSGGNRSVPSFSAATTAAAKQTSFSPARARTTAEGQGRQEQDQTLYHLPNATVLTEAIRSPEKARYRSAPAKKNGSNKGSGSGSRGSAQANLVSNALSSLTSKLSLLERENASSAARVAQLEAQLASASARKEREHDADVGQLRREVEGLLREERKRSGELEEVVRSLRAQNTHLDAVLAQQHSDLDSLRRRSAPPAPQPHPAAFSPGEELRSEVKDLKQGLQVLGFEVEGVRAVVEDLLRDKEERVRQGGWEREEEERRRVFEANAGNGAEQEEDEEMTPKASRINGPVSGDEVPGTPPSASFVSVGKRAQDADLSILRAEQELETARRTPRRAHRHQHSRKHVHTHHDHAHAQPPPPLSPTDSEASYRPSTATFDGESVSYSQEEEGYEHDDGQGFSTPATSVSSSSEYEEDEAETLPPLPAHHRRSTQREHKVPPVAEEPDFKRAEAIFADVSKATAHSPRRRQTRVSFKAKAKDGKTAKDRVVLVEEPSERLCTNCWGRKKDVELSEAEGKAGKRAQKEREKAKEREKELKRKESALRREKRREEHRRVLEGVLERLEDEFGVQKKIYLELTAEYQLMTSLTSTTKRRALADHLKASIDLLEDKAREVKRYADALDDLYEAMHAQSCPAPTRKRHAVV
ncbi:hypothetical protein JCM11251_005915 [Rhodosporidiobolus azoricus]